MSQPITTSAPTLPGDPRPAYAAATAWMTELMRGITSDQWSKPTPCTEFDVQTLARHIVGVGRRSVALGAGTDVFAVDPIAEVFDADSYADAVNKAIQLWSDDAKLAAPVRVPWGTVPGAGALWGYVNETLVHGWDLAVATSQDLEREADHAAAALAAAQQFIPAEIRASDEVPFGPVVTPRADAGPIERLANWSGRSSDGWV